VILDAASAQLPHLRRKVEAYADDDKASSVEVDGTAIEKRSNETAVAPIGGVSVAGEDELVGRRLRAQAPEPNAKVWLELSCRGGYRRPPEEKANTLQQMHRQLEQLGHPPPTYFDAAEHIVVYTRLSLEEARRLLAVVDCIYEYDVPPPDVHRWLLLRDQPSKEVSAFKLTSPPEDAPTVVLLDTGLATGHPLLAAAIRDASSVVPGTTSPLDRHGHGTRMAGVALHQDVAATLAQGTAEAPHWLQSVRVLVQPRQGTASDENRDLWPILTRDGVAVAEEVGSTDRNAFALAVTGPLDVVEPTKWSVALDELAYNLGEGRLFVVSTGNADVADVGLLEGYPQLNLEQRLENPAQAVNALSVGAYTTKIRLPPHSDFDGAAVIASEGGISPSTSSSARGGIIKPEVVLEGGNIAIVGGLPDTSIPTMTTLTTGHQHEVSPLAQIAMTSEATAHAVRLAADIWRHDAGLRSETVRGLIVHSADWTPEMMGQFPNLDERLSIVGYGVPDPVLATTCATDCATVIVEDRLSNAIEEEVLKRTPPKRRTTKKTETKRHREVKFFRLPVPEDVMLASPDTEVELRVTLSYFAEPNEFRKRVVHGLDLKWDMQGPNETEAQFMERMNKLRRPKLPKGQKYKPAKGYKWDVGITRRSRGTVQSDRWTGAASVISEPKLIAVVPVLGWWEQRDILRTLSLPFSLIVTLRAKGLPIYAPIKAAVAAVQVPAVEIAT